MICDKAHPSNSQGSRNNAVAQVETRGAGGSVAGGTAPPFRAKWLLGLAILTPQRYKIRSPLPEIYGKSDLENVKTVDFANSKVAKWTQISVLSVENYL